MYPDKSIEELESKAGTRLSGVALQAYLPPSLAKELDQIAHEREATIEEVLPEILQRGLSSGHGSVAMKDEGVVISEIDTGYVFSCPVCKGTKYRIIHSRPTNAHKLEEVT